MVPRNGQNRIRAQAGLDLAGFRHADVITLDCQVQVFRQSFLNRLIQRDRLRRVRDRLLVAAGQSAWSHNKES